MSDVYGSVILVARWQKANVVCDWCAAIVASSASVELLVVSVWVVSVKGGVGGESIRGSFVSLSGIVLVKNFVIGFFRILLSVEV